MRILTVLFLIPLALPMVSGAVVELKLPAQATAPLALAFDADGRLWMTLDGSWAVARFDAATNRTDIVPLPAAKAHENDSLWALRFAPDGALWTGSATHLHRVDPRTLQARSFMLRTPTQLAGDVFVTPDGVVWYAMVAADRLSRLDPATGNVTESLPPTTPFGPLFFENTPDGVFLTATYAGTYARFDPETGELSAGPAELLAGPVGITHKGSSLWIAEMGGDSVARVDPKTGTRDRYPTTPSPFYPNSGPSDVLVARDGSLWFAEHFADRIARLDPQQNVLYEYTVPSAPGTNVQRVAEAPDGSIWFAEWSKNQVGYVRHEPTTVPFTVPDRVSVERGASVRIVPALMGAPPASGSLLVGTGETSLRATVEGNEVLVDAAKADLGSYRVLVSVRQGFVNVGRYVTVDVTEPAAGSSPGFDFAVPSSLVAIALIVWRRGR